MMTTNRRGQGSGVRGRNCKRAGVLIGRAVSLLTLSIFLLSLAGCGDDTPKYNGPSTGLPYTPTPPPADPVAVIKTDAGDITLELYENDAPNTVANFITLAEKGYFDGLKFHRIIKYFMIQGGDPKGDGTGGPGYKFADEIDDNPNKEYDQYTLAMANSGRDTNGSQFFIVTNPKGTPHLKRNPQMHVNGHTIFGKVTKGQDVVDKLDKSPVAGEKPTPDVKMIAVKIVSKRNHPYEITDKVMDPIPPPASGTSPWWRWQQPALTTGEKKDPARTDARPDDKKLQPPPKTEAKPDEKKSEAPRTEAKPDEKKAGEKK